MHKHYFSTLFAAALLTSTLFSPLSAAIVAEPTKDAKELPKEPPKEAPKEEAVVTTHTVKIGGIDISYEAKVGTQLLNDDQSNPKASIFYTAYTKDGVTNKRDRPITFCFNGGPGSASVWLHLGILGPKRVDIDADGKKAKQPFQLLDNPYSLLDVTDLVFIDPVSTGFSRTVNGEDAKQFHGVEKDIKSVAEFIRLYITRNERWESPKFLAGESYGTTRASGLAQELHDNHHLYLDGLMLISCVLNFQTIRFASGNDLPYALFLPTYTSTALYHHKLEADLQQDVAKTMTEVEAFAVGEYTHALMMGDNLDPNERSAVLDKLTRYTGISREYIDRANLRLNIFRFVKELLKDERRTVGRFDSRLKGIDADLCLDTFEFDPSYENIVGMFTATFNNYVRTDLNWKHDPEYKIIADVQPWDYGDAKNQFLNVAENLRDTINKNTMLEVFVASGYSDLATPYFATEYTFSHMGLDPSLRGNITLETYEGGHMMYLNHPSLVKLKGDLSRFIRQRLAKNNP